MFLTKVSQLQISLRNFFLVFLSGVARLWQTVIRQLLAECRAENILPLIIVPDMTYISDNRAGYISSDFMAALCSS